MIPTPPRLRALHVNPQLQQLLDVADAHAYEQHVLSQLLPHDPHLRAVLRDLWLSLLEGGQVGPAELVVQHPMPPSHQKSCLPHEECAPGPSPKSRNNGVCGDTTSPLNFLATLQLQPVVVSSAPRDAAAAGPAPSGRALAGVVVRYGLDPALQPLHRSHTVLLGFPGIVTL